MGQAVTERQASQLACPEARVAVLTDAGATTAVNRQPNNRDPYTGAHCIGARCMHWQWMVGSGENKKGFCGLSGRPSN